MTFFFFFAFEGVESGSIYTFQRICLRITRMFGFIWRWTVRGHFRRQKIAQDNWELGSGPGTFQLFTKASAGAASFPELLFTAAVQTQYTLLVNDNINDK